QTGTKRKDYYAQLGYSLRGQNPWGRGGRVNLDMELQKSSLDFDSTVPGGGDESDVYLRIRRASYAVGGDRDRSRRYHFGRFYSTVMPELGLLDGIEVSERRGDGLLYGTSIGWQPSYGPEIQFEDAMAISGWVQRSLGPEFLSSVAAAVQKTWFHGKPDRDWMLFKGTYANRGPWSAHGSVSFDLYDSEDIAKSTGFETTEYRMRVKRDLGRETGVALYHSMTRFPEVRRSLPVDYAVGQVSTAQTFRTGINGWKPISDRRSLSGRYEFWSDENADGGYTEVSLDTRLDGEFASHWYVSGFVSNTELADITALRLGLRGFAKGGSWSTGLDLGQYKQFDTNGVSQSDFQGSLRGGWTGAIGNQWFLGLDAAVHFGEDRDAYSLGFLLQRSF
ncbi:MAG: hypothetical protein KDB61_13955, partial [Planctomycetes bacterium]|nr:hypothetical protein [Planctomycetota bacterium]